MKNKLMSKIVESGEWLQPGIMTFIVRYIRENIASGNVKYLQSMLIKIEKNTIEKDDREYARELSFSLEEY